MASQSVFARVMQRCHERSIPIALKRSEYAFLEEAGEDPEAELDAFTIYKTLPKRVAWSTIKKEEYESLKDSFAQRGMPINADTPEADIMKFKESLLACDAYLW